MYLPPIQPTGAMASGEYVDYMLTYLDAAMDDVTDALSSYVGSYTLESWEDQWDRTINDLTTKVTDLQTAVSKLKMQTIMARNAINNL